MSEPVLATIDALAPAGLTPVEEPSSLTDRVHERLRAAILSGRLGPGTHLSVPALARQLEVSRTPVRDALFRLEGDGLVRSVPNRGAIVMRPGIDDLRELFELREVLDGLAARLAADRIDAATREHLRALLQAQTQAVEAHDTPASVRHDLEFHRVVREASGNQRLIADLDQLEDQVGLAMQTTAARRSSVSRALREHRSILAALDRGDPERAEATARSHVRRVRRTLVRVMGADEQSGAGDTHD